MDDPSRHHWYGEEPFPWAAVIAGAAFGLVLLPLASWIGFELIDQNLEAFAG